MVVLKRKIKTSNKRLKLNLDFIVATKKTLPKGWGVFAKKIIVKCLNLKGVERGDIGLTIVDDVAIKKLNKKFRKKNSVTDVLSFIYSFDRKIIVGDIIICLPQAMRQAKKLKHPLGDELNALLTHGTLHLLGFDHDGSKPKELMMAAEKLILGGKRRLVS